MALAGDLEDKPFVKIQLADDCHLSSANTSNSKLYVLFYSSNAILKRKLLTAIKTKNFRFVQYFLDNC